MRRPFVISTGALALALSTVALLAQNPPAQQPPAGQPPAGQPPAGQPPAGQTPAGQTPAATEKPAAPTLAFTTNAGLLLVQVKPDQTSVFEEMMAKLKSALAASTDAGLKAQGAALKVYKASEPMAGNTLYVVVADPATPNTEYSPLQLLAKTMTDDQKRLPETAEMFKKYAATFAGTPEKPGVNKLNLTPVAGGM
jgi:hypothetical protein